MFRWIMIIIVPIVSSRKNNLFKGWKTTVKYNDKEILLGRELGQLQEQCENLGYLI